MAVSLQVVYSTENGTTFNHEYYMKNHMELISSGMGKHWESVQVTKGSCQTNRLKHQKHEKRAFYEAIRERHSVRAASRFSLKVLRFESDLCELK